MATITQITSSTVTAEVQGNTAYTLYTSQSPNSGFNPTNITFTTPHGATTYSFTYTPTSGTYLALVGAGEDVAYADSNNKLYIDQQHGIASRLASITNVSSGTSFDIQCSSPTTFYNLTSTATGLTEFRMVGPDPKQTGVYFVLRNNTASNYLTLTRSSSASATITGIPNPLVIPPGTSANLVWNGSGYTMF
jgi:hypothetical protein